MTIINRARELVAEFEGLRLEPYRCEAGLLSIGYGHRCDAGQSAITKEDAEMLLDLDLMTAANEVEALRERAILTESQQVALISFIFNVGVSAWRDSTMRMKILGGDLGGAAYEFGRWMHVRRGGVMVTSKGLQQRRLRERILFGGM